MGKKSFTTVSPEFTEGRTTVTLEESIGGAARYRMVLGAGVHHLDPVTAEELADALDRALEWREAQLASRLRLQPE